MRRQNWFIQDKTGYIFTKILPSFCYCWCYFNFVLSNELLKIYFVSSGFLFIWLRKKKRKMSHHEFFQQIDLFSAIRGVLSGWWMGRHSFAFQCKFAFTNRVQCITKNVDFGLQHLNAYKETTNNESLIRLFRIIIKYNSWSWFLQKHEYFGYTVITFNEDIYVNIIIVLTENVSSCFH